MATISGGEKLKERLEAIARAAASAATLKVGFMAGATYPDGTSVPMVAAIQEWGAPRARIPPRPYFRNMVAAKSKEWPKAIAGLLKATDYDAKRTLMITGEAIKGQLQQSITDTNVPPLRPLTLMLRKMRIGRVNDPITGAMLAEARQRLAAGESTAGVSTKPLIWSGHLQNSVTFTVN